MFSMLSHDKYTVYLLQVCMAHHLLWEEIQVHYILANLKVAEI